MNNNKCDDCNIDSDSNTLYLAKDIHGELFNNDFQDFISQIKPTIKAINIQLC